MKILLANPRGFCAGVDRAITIVERLLEKYGPPVYVRHELVHNRAVVHYLQEKGVVFVDEVEEVPEGVPLVFSAHGVSSLVQKQGEQRPGPLFDATCPLVSKVHYAVGKRSTEGYDCVLIGHAGHPEVEGTLGRFNAEGKGQILLVQSEEDAMQLDLPRPEMTSWSSQTTLSVDDTQRIVEILQSRFPQIRGPRSDDICYATQNRQDAVKQLALQTSLVLVVGSQASSNSNRLVELAMRCGVQAYLLDDPADLREEWLQGLPPQACVGVTAGASTPEFLVRAMLDRLESMGLEPAQEISSNSEDMHFSLPVELR